MLYILFLSNQTTNTDTRIKRILCSIKETQHFGKLTTNLCKFTSPSSAQQVPTYIYIYMI